MPYVNDIYIYIYVYMYICIYAYAHLYATATVVEDIDATVMQRKEQYVQLHNYVVTVCFNRIFPMFFLHL